MKKLLICTAIAAAMGLTGCGGGEELNEVAAQQVPVERPFARVKFDPANSDLNIPNDLLMLPNTSLFDFTLELEDNENFDPTNPLHALGALDGWSTQYPFVIDLLLPNGVSIDETSLANPAAIRIFEATQALEGTSAACQGLVAIAAAPGLPCEIGEELVLGQDFVTTMSDADTINVVPLSPLKANQGYLMVVTEALKDNAGRGIRGASSWELGRQDINTHPLASPAQLQLQQLVNVLAGAAATQGISVEENSYTTYFSTQSAGTVTGTVKQLQVAPFALALQSALEAGLDLPSAQAAAAQFLPAILVNESPRGDTAFDVLATTLLGEDTVAQLGSLGITSCASMLPVLADPTNPLNPTVSQVFAGIAPFCAATLKTGQINLPYYLNPENPLGDWWRSACSSGAGIQAIEGANPGTVGALIAAGAVGPNNDLCQLGSGGQLFDLDLSSIGITDRRHLTKVAPIPATNGSNPDGTETLEVQVTVPDEAIIGFLASIPGSGVAAVTKPDAGWPVVIIQHGITSKKEDTLAVTGALAMAGFATVAIDHPLHGSRGFMIGERAVNASGGFGGATTDYMNLTSLLTARDNVRQSIVDTLGLRLGLNAWVDLTGSADIDSSTVHFLGQSLGSITGIGTVANANTSLGGDLAAFDTLYAFKTAALSVPGGGIAQVLVESAGFGPLVAASVVAGSSVEFQQFLGQYAVENQVPVSEALIPAYGLFVQSLTPAQQAEVAATIGTFAFAAQTALDAGDPTNYAARLAATTPVLMHEVVGGGANDDGSTAASDLVIPNVTAIPNSGTEALARIMALPSISSTTVGETPQSGIVRFTAGEHGSLLNPSSSVATTTEMQLQVAAYFQSMGTAIVVTNEGVVAN